MEQIYYTQCPMGYGLGASNGFQVKRISKGYPPSADFRHLNMRAYPAGGRTLAPTTLRYRRADGVAEVAWLTPRPFEYETERGQWGRPGGHFAHGIRLGPEEQGAVHSWFAGLYDSPRWVRSDRVPSRGEAPAELMLADADLLRAPRFSEVAPLADGLAPDLLARLFTALAIAVREGRTLFLVDAAEQLGPRIALLTFAFPEPLRPALTFSTFHDRPEELPGLRIHGSTPQIRLNRPGLLAQGLIADLEAGAIEPRVDPSPWAMSLATWFTRRSADDSLAWEATEALAKTTGVGWEEADLDPLFAHHEESLGEYTRPVGAEAWDRFSSRAAWYSARGVAGPWSDAHGPSWWKKVGAEDSPEARESLSVVLAFPEAWTPQARVGEWGEVVATAWRSSETEAREVAISSTLKAAPPSARPGFLRSLTAHLPEASAASLVRRLQRDQAQDRAALLPIQAGRDVRVFLDERRPEPLEKTLRQARSVPGILPAVLDAVAHEAKARPGATATLASALGPLILNHDEARSWALHQGDEAVDWLAPSLRPLLAEASKRESWTFLRDRTQADSPAWARAFLTLAGDPRLPDDAFIWGIEELLLRIPAETRPRNPDWPGRYIDRTPSDVELIDRVLRSRPENLAVRDWIKRAVLDSELKPEHRARLDRLQGLVRALKTGAGETIASCGFAAIPRVDHPRVLGWLLNRTADKPGLVLDAFREAWPDLCEPVNRPALAEQVARWKGLADLIPYASRWLDRVRWAVDRLADPTDFGPDSFAAEILAATARMPDSTPNLWGLRQWIFDDERCWKTLGRDLGNQLLGRDAGSAAEVVDEWVSRISIGLMSGRFWELVLNSCDGERLAVVVPEKAGELRTLDRVDWWQGRKDEEAIPEMREGFVRLIPMAPLPERSLTGLRAWLEGPKAPKADDGIIQADSRARRSHLSVPMRSRWKCVEALTNFHWDRQALSTWRSTLLGWKSEPLPVADLTRRDRLDFVVHAVGRIPPDLGQGEVEDVARWLIALGFDDPEGLRQRAEVEGGDGGASLLVQLASAARSILNDRRKTGELAT